MPEPLKKTLLQSLKKGIEKLNLTISSENQIKLIDFIFLLQKWNRRYNLTAITDLNQMITHHVLDSLAIAPLIKQAKRILDVGTGAGFPGVPLALCYPEKKFILLDSNGKKIRFLTQALAEINITNAKPVQERVESYNAHEKFDAIICRAVGSLKDLINNTKHCCSATGRFVLMKGTYPTQEIAEIKWPLIVQSTKVPGLNAERHVIIIEADEVLKK